MITTQHDLTLQDKNILAESGIITVSPSTVAVSPSTVSASSVGVSPAHAADKKSNNKTKTIVSLLVIFTILALCAIIVLCIKVYELSESNKSNAIAIEDYVLPNDKLVVDIDTETEISGQLLADGISYHFASISNITTEHVVFMNTNYDQIQNDNKWRGFKFQRISDKKSECNVYDLSGDEQSIVFQENTSVSVEEKAIIKSLFTSIVAKDFVELSIKLGSFGYLGNMNHLIHSIHAVAKWVFEVAQNENAEWTADLSGEFGKANNIIFSSKHYGHWIGNTEQLYNVTENSDEIRRRLGNCGRPINHCDNACYGRCGPNCDCWAWVCGDCKCWQGCFAHDYYCSCNGFDDFWCINFFWIRCSYSYWWTYY